MFRSEAESIYQAWNTSAAKNAVTPVARATGKFDKFRTGGFDVVVTRLIRYRRTRGSWKAAEQTWKLLEKFKRRKGEIVARELMKVLEADSSIKGLLAQFPASMFPGLKNQARQFAVKLDPNNIVFPKTGKRIRILRLLGKGGMGGAVYLGEEPSGHRYAVKHFIAQSHKIPGYGKDTNPARLEWKKHYLLKYFEAALTTTCVDELTIGRDQWLLLELGEGTVDYATLNMSDILSVFQDLQKLYDYSRHYMDVHVTQDVSVLHLDIHGENLMRFGGKLRLIDFGFAQIFSPSQGAEVRKAKPVKYDRNNVNLYFQHADFLEDKKSSYDPSEGTWKKYIDDWQQAYREAPEVQRCGGCGRQYPVGLKIEECFRCGSKKIETAKLRRADIEGLARLKGVSPGTIGDNPYAHGTVASVDPQQYGCVVLTAVLIKEIWTATEKGRDLGMGGKPARAILNVNVYSLARKGFHRFKGEAQASVVRILLLWFDEMMRRLFDREPFTARDAVKFFGGHRESRPSRHRRHSVSF
ncbi:MAG: hypothetical protein ACLFRG_13860 [Desulfococcaceae bacterium]